MGMYDSELLVYGFAIFLRAGAMLYVLPILNRPVPVLIRSAISLLLAALVTSVVPPESVGVSINPEHILDLGILGLVEIFIGFVMGYSVQVIFYLCQFAGRLISMEMGLMQSNLFNPLMAEQATVIGTAFTSLSVVLIFVLEIHHMIIVAFIRSLQLLPVGAPLIGGTSVESVINGVGNIFLIGTQMSAPLIAVNFIVTLAFAVLGRAVPNMNVLILSFGVRILAGFSVLIIVLVVVVQFLLGVINETPERMLQFLPFR